jgi:hypothetical protein
MALNYWASREMFINIQSGENNQQKFTEAREGEFEPRRTENNGRLCAERYGRPRGESTVYLTATVPAPQPLPFRFTFEIVITMFLPSPPPLSLAL